MTTSLKRQLAALAAPASSLLVADRRRSSILFTPQDAAKYDKETFYQIGQEGLNELVNINGHLFTPFLTSVLFSEDSKKYERAVEDSANNQRLDEAVGNFLIALHPYMMTKAALKCLEWLVYRFHIERFNVQSILQCILPYYDTKSFVMIVQVLEIERYQGNQKWDWLVPCIQSGAPLRKTVLHDNTNSSFALWLFSTFEQILKVHKDYPENLQVYLGFMASTLVGILNKIKSDLVANPRKVQNKKIIGINILNQIFNLLQLIREDPAYADIKNNDEIYSMAYVVMAMLAVCCKEIPGMIEAIGSGLKRIFKLLIVKRGSSQLTETYLLLNLMIDFLNRHWTFNSPLTFTNTMKDLATISQQWNLSRLATKLIVSNLNEEKNLKPSKIFELVEAIEMTTAVRSEILRTVYFFYRKSKTKRKWAKFFLTTLEKRYPMEFELLNAKDDVFSSDLAKYKTGKDFHMLSQHSSSLIRADAVKRLIRRATVKKSKNNIHETGGRKMSKKLRTKFIPHKSMKAKTIIPDKNQTAATLVQRFSDECPDVLTALLKPKLPVLLKIFSPETLAKGLFFVIKSGTSVLATKLALKKLCGIANLEDVEAELKRQVMACIIPHLFPRKMIHLKLAKLILKTKFGKSDKFLKQFKSESSKETSTTSTQDFCKASFELVNELDEEYKQQLFSNLENATQITFACVLLPPDDFLERLPSFAEQNLFVKCTSFPVDESNFSKCILLAEKKGKISFELALTKLCKVKTRSFEKMERILKFVIKQAEHLENRDTVLKFLKIYFQACFQTKREQYTFWMRMLEKAASDKYLNDENDAEFYLIRVIQLFSAFINANPDVLKLEPEIIEVIDIDDESLVTKSTRKSTKIAKGKIRKNEPATSTLANSMGYFDLVELLLSFCTTDDSHRVRTCSLSLLRILQQNAPEVDKCLNNFVEFLLQYENEILADYSQVQYVVGRALKEDGEMIDMISKSLANENFSEVRKIALLQVCSQVGSDIFAELYPSVKSLINTESLCSKFLVELLAHYDGKFDEDLLQAALKHKDVSKCVLKKIDRDVFENYTLPQKKKILDIFIENTLNCNVPEIKVAVLRCVRKWILDASIVSSELMKTLELEKRRLINGAQKSKKPESGKVLLKDSGENWIFRAEVILEFIQGKKRLLNKTKLIQSLFKILNKCISMEEQSSVEYLKQLVLTSLTMCCQDDDDSKHDSKDFASFDVQTVIDCLRCSRNPQTHHHALILLNYAARPFREQVLHGIMSLFTFMGNSILRQDDAYSTQLIQQTVINIIPGLAKTENGSVHLNVSADLFRVFTSAVQDIPVHRRLPVFSSLVHTLHPEQTMWQLCIILVDNALQYDRTRNNLNAHLELAVDLAWSFGADVVLSTTGQIYNFLISLPIFSNMTEEEFNKTKTRQSVMERYVLDFTRKKSFRDVLIVVNYVLELVSQICSKFGSQTNEALEYDALLEKCLAFSRKVAGLQDDKLFRSISHRNLDVIDAINAALDPPEFIEAVALILVRDDTAVKRKILEMLNQRILQKVEWFKEMHNLLDLVPLLLEIANIEPTTDEITPLVQTAFFSLKLLSKHLALQYPDAFVPVFELANKHSCHKNKLLCASAILCLSELFCLKSLILPNLTDVSNAILKGFKSSAKLQKESVLIIEDKSGTGEPKSENENLSMTAHLLCISTFTCLNRMVEHLGSFVGMKFMKKSLVAVLSMNAVGGGEKASHRSKVFEQKLKTLLKVIAAKIPLRNLLVPLKEAFRSLSDNPKALISLTKILKDSLAQTSKPDFTLIANSLTDVFLDDLLSFREKRTENQSPMDDDDTTIDNVEDAVLDCFITGVVLKMSESHFRPLYHKIFDWAEGSNSRLITFYKLSAAAAERLKSLFVTFAGYVINKAVSVILNDVQLAKAIVQFLFHIFSNDKEGFVTTDRFNALVQPLVDLVESDFILSGDIKMDLVNNTLIQLAVATNDLNRWQHLIELISLKSGHSNKLVRLNVLSTLAGIANELAKDFLPLLPPAVPFLAELMNDDDPEVESETQKLLLNLEEIVGEPLQPYFTT